MKKFKLIALSIIFSFIISVVLFFVVYSLAFASRVYPNVKIGGFNLGGKNRSEAENFLVNRAENLAKNGFRFEFNGEVWHYLPEQFNLNYDIKKTIDAAFSVGREKNPAERLFSRANQLLKETQFKPVFSFNESNLQMIVGKIGSRVNIVGKDASVSYIEGQGWKIEKEIIGQGIIKEKIKEEIIMAIDDMETETRILPIEIRAPIITADQLKKITKKLENLTAADLILRYQDRQFTIEKGKISSWVELIAEKNKPLIIINNSKIQTYVEVIAAEINKEPIDAKLTIKDGRANVFQPAQKGLKLDQKKLVSDINSMLNKQMIGSTNNSHLIDLAVNTEEPKINDNNIDTLDIKELVAKATTSFKKSPNNRRHNIKLGSQMFNGVLLRPGEEFSALKYLGKVDAASGFLPELVIKEDATIPEVGGGLCQVSTTMFRAALAAGFPVTERTNHKYRVSYYEPPVGMDATIYEPSPDLRFINDSSSHILIQGYIEGDNITFEFYGAKDGRKVEIGEPQVYDFVSPPPPAYIEDSSLAPGETKIIEKEHRGAKASFHYKVINSDGSIRFEKTFNSNYKPWQAKYRIGPTPPPIPAPTPEPASAAPEQQPVPASEGQPVTP